jgi:hypothetical protein
MWGMGAGVAVNLYVRFATPVAWTWYVMIGTGVTVGAALLASLFYGRTEAMHE